MGGAKFKSAAILAGGLRGSRNKRIWTVVAMAPGSKCKLRSCLVSSSPLADAGAMGHHLLGRWRRARWEPELLTERGRPATALPPRALLCAVDPAVSLLASPVPRAALALCSCCLIIHF